MTLKSDSLFHLRFTNLTLVSHFTPIPVERETNGHFRPLVPMTDLSETMKRSPAKIHALVSREIGFVSPSFHVSFHAIFALTVGGSATIPAKQV